jgi:hypothetical protein
MMGLSINRWLSNRIGLGQSISLANEWVHHDMLTKSKSKTTNNQQATHNPQPTTHNTHKQATNTQYRYSTDTQ